MVYFTQKMVYEGQTADQNETERSAEKTNYKFSDRLFKVNEDIKHRTPAERKEGILVMVC